jgi:hypothetical protein
MTEVTMADGKYGEAIQLVIDLNPVETSTSPDYPIVVWVVRAKTSHWVKDERIEVRDTLQARAYCNGFNSARGYAGLPDLAIVVRS